MKRDAENEYRDGFVTALHELLEELADNDEVMKCDVYRAVLLLLNSSEIEELTFTIAGKRKDL